MSGQVAVDNRVLARLIRRVFPEASSVSVEAADRDRRLVVVYRARVDDVVFYLRLAEQQARDLRGADPPAQLTGARPVRLTARVGLDPVRPDPSADIPRCNHPEREARSSSMSRSGVSLPFMAAMEASMLRWASRRRQSRLYPAGRCRRR